MDIALQVNKDVHDQLRDQELSLQFINQDEIQIIGDPKKQLFGKLIFTIMGAAIVSFSMIFAEGSDSKSLIIMILGSLLGLSLIVMPFLNFYSKKQFNVVISRLKKQIVITRLRSKEVYKFSELQDLSVKSFKMDDYVSDETADSNSFCSKFYLNTKDGKDVSLFTFSSRDRKSLDSFSDVYGNFLADFMSLKLEKIDET